MAFVACVSVKRGCSCERFCYFIACMQLIQTCLLGQGRHVLHANHGQFFIVVWICHSSCIMCRIESRTLMFLWPHLVI